jgi:hypothetical protein
MLDKINVTLDVALKTLSLLFMICLFIGTSVTWGYLNKSGFGHEISSLISSPQILLTIALYSLIVSVSVIFIVLFVPVIIDFCEKSDDLKWAQQPNSRFILHYFLILSPLCLFMLAAWLGISGAYFNLMYVSISLLMACVFYKFYGGPENANIANKIKHFGVVIFALLIAFGMLLFSLLFFSKITLFLETNEFLQWMILLGIFLIYSGAVAMASSSSSYMLYAPVVLLSLVVLVIIFADTASTNIASRLGVGSYTSSYAVESKYLAAIKSDNSYAVEKTNDKNIVILRNVWVIAALPNKLILSANSSSLETYSIPASAILGELGDATKSMQ